MEDGERRKPTFILMVKMKMSNLSEKANRLYQKTVFQVMPIDLTGSSYKMTDPALYDEHGAWFYFRMKDNQMQWPKGEAKLALKEARRMAKDYGVPMILLNVPAGIVAVDKDGLLCPLR